MSFACRVIRDSIYQTRLTTVEITYPRFIHAEILTHSDRARNSASSRAIPWPKMMERIATNPVVPILWGSEQKGMQTGGEIDDPAAATAVWLQARDNALESAKQLAALGVHKSLVNRITEPWMWITVVMTATEWSNLFRLRCHPDAEIHFQKIACMIREAMKESTPVYLRFGEWHLPYIIDIEEEQAIRDAGLDPCKISTARCARVSYLTQDGVRNFAKDIELFERLVQGSGFGHWSPHEHVAQAQHRDLMSGPYRGWEQYRKMFAQECG